MHCAKRSINLVALSKLPLDSGDLLLGWHSGPHTINRLGDKFLSLNYFLSMRVTIKYLRNTRVTPESFESRLHGFLQTLTIGRHYSCSNPRDFMYGFLGLAPDEFACVFQPDYNSAVVHIFQHFAILFTLHTNILLLLSAAYFIKREDRSTPTWVPDWSNGERRMTNTTRIHMAGLGVCSATGKRTFTFKVVGEGIMRLSGVALDQVKNIVAPFSDVGVIENVSH